jgi:hypothetical protein
MIKLKWADTLWWETTKQTRNYQLFSVTIREPVKEQDVQFLNIIIWRLNINIYYYWLEQLFNKVTKEAKEEPVQDS